MQIRTAMPDDYAAIKKLCTDEGWTSVLRSDFDDALSCSMTLVAAEGSEIAGYLRALTDGYLTLYICEILVAPDMRKRGIARALVDEARRRYPLTRTDLISAQDEFYLALGFRNLGGGMRKSAQ